VGAFLIDIKKILDKIVNKWEIVEESGK